MRLPLVRPCTSGACPKKSSLFRAGNVAITLRALAYIKYDRLFSSLLSQRLTLGVMSLTDALAVWREQHSLSEASTNDFATVISSMRFPFLGS